jgi:hypothetical protein
VTATAHFVSPADLAAASVELTFAPRLPDPSLSGALRGLRIHVRDHRGREVPRGERTLEAWFDTFTFSQSSRTEADARHAALDVSYGRDPLPVWILGREGRGYELGPQPAPDDSDERSPAVIAWADGAIFYFLASGELPLTQLIDVAASIY